MHTASPCVTAGQVMYLCLNKTVSVMHPTCLDANIDGAIMEVAGANVPAIYAVLCPRPVLCCFSWHWTSHPSGAKGVRSKLKGPCTYAWAKMPGLAWDGRRMLYVSSAWGSSSHHSLIGKLSGSPARMEIKCFLNVFIATSATFLRWHPGGTSSSLHVFVMHSLRSAQTALSMTCFLGSRPAAFNLSGNRRYASCISSLFFCF